VELLGDLPSPAATAHKFLVCKGYQIIPEMLSPFIPETFSLVKTRVTAV